MSSIDLVDLEDIEGRLAFVMHELKVIGDLGYAIVNTAHPNHAQSRWIQGRFSAFMQQANDAVWTARCSVGLIPPKDDEQSDHSDEETEQ